MNLIVGLGNPGEQYKKTRHNIGFAVIDLFLKSVDLSANTPNVPDLVGDIKKIGLGFMILKPASFMNNSGVEVKKVTNYFKIPPENILVIHDDVDLPLGTVKLETGSGSAGHKGVESIITQLNSQNFARVRIGINRPGENVPTDQYVLEKFTEEETDQVEGVQKEAINQIQNWLKA